MFRGLCLILLFSLTNLVFAQDNPVIMPDDLPDPLQLDAPIDKIVNADVSQFAWLDNDTLVFEIDRIGYQYDVSSDTLTELESSPFIAEMNEDFHVWYQVLSNGGIIQSPYVHPGGEWYDIIYPANLSYNCGATCGGRIFMSGLYRYSDGATPSSDYIYRPLAFEGIPSSRIIWSRDNSTALITLTNEVGAPPVILHVNLISREITTIPLSYGDITTDSLLAISEDGQRVAFRSHTTNDPRVTSTASQNLLIWETPVYSENCACTYDGVIHRIEPLDLMPETDQKFAGVGFVDADTLLYIGELGLMRHNLLTGISTPLDRELNVGWIRTAVFSPDNQHVAITTEQGLFVLPLFAP